jgi:hypothetical protein
VLCKEKRGGGCADAAAVVVAPDYTGQNFYEIKSSKENSR